MKKNSVVRKSNSKIRIHSKIKKIDWFRVTLELDKNGFAVVPRLLSVSDCKSLIKLYEDSSLYRKTVTMERYRFGSGEYKYFDYPLPDFVQSLRETIYPFLAPIANSWMNELGIETRYPKNISGLQKFCHSNDQTKPTALILKYVKGGFNTLHQDLYGEVYFPFQAALFLNEPDQDYEGGDFVMTQSIPRSQSKAIVLKPKQGDMILFTTNFRPIQGKKGYYRAVMKHGVSEVYSGERHTLGIIFHDATN
ncbi:2OG-Fe(II) oxygenase [Leptospira stimsonii]|uniref:Prolyl 4-hydroxylase subunit alpha n=1 Tax=Leptospira stimsonii TaxID=2202203 RepID=A0A8B3CUN6_9LEPT|nr:2OG-Fe(II) oxygenase [Leptospira stimsonii]RHX88967.1 prolyl 4-hydroxylase subunit alpha [Leptospira stimsonii]